MKLFLCGDVMTGRGVDQILPTPVPPGLRERVCCSALDYVALAERASGPIPRRVGFDYVWGDLLTEIDQRSPDLRVINLETAVTARGTPEARGINYRMHPANLPCLAAARIDCCVLANNHVLDWGPEGLTDTLDALHAEGLATAGAGAGPAEAAAPAVLDADGQRLLVLAYGCPSGGVPEDWAAARQRPGVNLLPDLSTASLRRIARDVDRWAGPGDIVLVSLHWGGNWGYRVEADRQRFARRLIEEARVDVIHGHSSHHPMGIEVHRGRPILYGCGDLINDYEGIRGYEEFRADLVLGYFLEICAQGDGLRGLEMTPFRLHRFRLERPAPADLDWIAARMSRECAVFGHGVEVTGRGSVRLRWQDQQRKNN